MTSEYEDFEDYPEEDFKPREDKNLDWSEPSVSSKLSPREQKAYAKKLKYKKKLKNKSYKEY